MSEFDAFESAEQTQQEEADPAADFLAREQDQLAELGDSEFAFSADGGTTEEQQPEVDTNFQSPESTSEVPAAAAADDGGAFDPFSGSGTGASDFAMLGEGDQPANIPGLDDLDERLQESDQAPADPYASVRQVDTQRAEPEKIKIWREEQKERLEKKDQNEGTRMIEWREQAKKELDDWYRHRDEQLDKTKASNREGESEFIKERDDTVPGHEWERICRLCEFNPKNSRTTKDVARMRGILLQLKQNPIIKAQ